MITLIVGGKYDIRRQLGSGGMSDVYLAVDTHLSMKWALKRIRCNDPEHPYLADSIIAEATILRKVKHKNLVRIVDIFREEESLYLVMEYVEGKNLGTVIKHDPEYAKSKAQKWTLELLGVLEELHGRKPPIIYRDMKPENIMVRANGSLCLIDFGTAKERLDNNGVDKVALGTRTFAAPEQFEGYSDERSDIYSLGRTLEVIPCRNILWKKILRKATADDPERRFQSVSEFKKAVLHFTGFRKKIIRTILAVTVFVSLLAGIYMRVIAGDQKVVTADAYRKAIEAGNNALLRGEFGEADKMFTDAIMEIDGTRPEGYLAILSLYRKRGKTEEGLERIDGFIKENYGEIEKMDELLYECGLTAFYDLGDYKKAEIYLRSVSEKTYPHITYLIRMSTVLSSFEIDKNEMLAIIRGFGQLAEARTNRIERVKSDLLISSICLTFLEKDDTDASAEFLEEAEDRVRDACMVLQKKEYQMDDDIYEDLKADAEEQMSVICKKRGEIDPDLREKYYEESIFYMENNCHGIDGQKALAAAKMMFEIGKITKAEKYCGMAEKYGGKIAAEAYVLRLKYCLTNNTDNDTAIKIYKQALSINGIHENSEFRKIEAVINANTEKHSKTVLTNDSLEIGIKGFDDFKVYEGSVTILSYVSGMDLNLEKTALKIERRGMEGKVLQEMYTSPGSITIREEGNYKVTLHGEDYSGNVSEKNGYFTIDKNEPVVMDFSTLDKKTFSSISLTDDPRNYIRDYSFVTCSLTLSGKDYDGSKVTKPGHYILKMTAVDEAGHRTEEKAEFIIIKDRASNY